MGEKVKTSVVKLIPFALTALVIACAVALQEGTFAAPPSTAPATSPTSAISTPTGFGPLTYFETNCARCHGPYGSAYGETFGKHLDDAQLEKVIDDMAYGPGNAPLQPRELAVQVAYHKAMISRTPFVVVTKISVADGKATVEGEAPPETPVTVAGFAATFDGHTWRVTVPAGKSFAVVARRDGNSATVEVSEAP